MKGRVAMVVILLFSLFNTGVYANSEIPPEVKQAALDGLEDRKSYLLNSDDHERTGYGYANKKEVEQATISDGYRIHSIDYEKLIAEERTFLNLVLSREEWEFIVTSEGKPISYLTVGMLEGSYANTRFGGDASYLYQAIQKFQKDHNTVPTLVLNGLTYYLVTKGPNNEEIAMEVPNGIDKPSLQYQSSDQILDEVYEQFQNYREGERGGLSHIDSTPGHDRSSTASIGKTSLAASALVLVILFAVLFFGRRLLKWNNNS